MVSRGVLLDVARALGRDVLEPGYPITPDDLDAACELAGVDARAGRHRAGAHRPDGAPGARSSRDLVAYTWPSPGLTIETAEWFHRHDVAAVATDTLVFEVFPCQHEDAYLPVHLLHLVEMGLTQGQNWVLDALADGLRRRRALQLPARRHPAAVDPGARHAAQPGRAQVASTRWRGWRRPRAPWRRRAPDRCAAACARVPGSRPEAPVAR